MVSDYSMASMLFAPSRQRRLFGRIFRGIDCQAKQLVDNADCKSTE